MMEDQNHQKTLIINKTMVILENHKTNDKLIKNKYEFLFLNEKIN